jgi:hypothetical protein
MLLGYIVSEEKIKIDNFLVVNSIPQDTDLPKLISLNHFSFSELAGL